MIRKKLCLLSYDLRSGGAERVISQWSVLLSDFFDVYMTTFRDEVVYPFGGKYVCLDVKDDYGSPLSKIQNVIKRASALHSFVKKEKIDIVLSFCNECNLANTLSLHVAKKICSIRSVSDLNTNLFVKYVVYSNRNRIIIQTEALKRFMVDTYGKRVKNKLFVYGNPFNVTVIRSMAGESAPLHLKAILDKYKTLIHVGTFKKAKNHANLLKSFEIVADAVPDACLVMVGSDVGLGGEIKNMAKQSKYPERIFFVGEVNNPFSIESRGAIFVFPSLAEGIPNALAEAMIVGLPVVSANCPTGPAELLSATPFDIEYNDDGYCDADYGVLVKPFSGPSDFSYENITEENVRFAKPIIKALKDPEYHHVLRQKSNEGAKRFDIDVYTEGLIDLINNIAYGK